MKFDVWRSRWAAAGAAIAITFGGGGLLGVHALGSNGDASVLVPVVPTRVLDTRDAVSPIHAIGPGGTATLSLVDSLPADATAASINLTVTNGTAASYLTLFPTGGEMPLASSINWASSNPHGELDRHQARSEQVVRHLQQRWNRRRGHRPRRLLGSCTGRRRIRRSGGPTRPCRAARPHGRGRRRWRRRCRWSRRCRWR